MPSVGVHTFVTNPLSSGYFVYLACVDSWSQIADDVVVVDGGSCDGSIEYMWEWIGKRENVRVVNTPLTHWGQGDRFAWPQVQVNRQAGYETMNTDWAIHVDADHVAGDFDRERLRGLLAQHEEHLCLSMPVCYFRNGDYHLRQRCREWVLNKRLARTRGVELGWGLNQEEGVPTDYPITVQGIRRFRDPETGMTKPVCTGPTLKAEGRADIDVRRYGHFFLRPIQCYRKCRRWSRAEARFQGKHAKLPIELLATCDLLGVSHRLTVEELLSRDHPSAFARVASVHYKSGMIGGYCYSRRAQLYQRMVAKLAWASERWRKGVLDRFLPRTKEICIVD